MSQTTRAEAPAPPPDPLAGLRDELKRKDAEIERLRDELQRQRRLVEALEARGDGEPAGDLAGRRRAEERLLSLLDGVSLGVAISRDGLVRFANQRFLAMLGYGAGAEVVGRRVTDFIAPRYHAQVQDRLRARRLGSPLPSEVEHVALRKDGSELPFHMVAMPIDLVDGPAVIGLLTDVSEQLRTQRALRRQVAFDELLNGLLAGLASASGEGIDQHIGVAVREIGLFVGAEEAHLLLHEPSDGTVSALFTWSAEGTPRLPVEVRGLPAEGPFGWMLSRVRAGEVVAIDGLGDIPEDAALHREFFRLQGARSVLYVPMRGAGGRVRGALWLRSFSRPIQRTGDDLKMLRMMSDAIASALDRKQAEEALRESERRLRSIATATPTFLIEIDAQARIRYINRTIDGVLEPMVIGTALRDWVRPEQQAEVDAAVARAFATGLPTRLEYEREAADGARQTYMAELCAYPGTPPRGALLTVTDISEWKRTARALGESEQRLRNLFDNAPSGIFHALPTGRIARANPSIARMLGYDSPDQMMAAIADEGMSWLAEPAEALPALGKVLQSSEWVSHDARIFRRDRSILDGRLLLRKVEGPGGGIAYIEGFLEDLTERRRAEQERDQLFNLSLDVFTVSGLDGYLKQWNPAVERLLGWSAEELRSEPFLARIHPDDRARLVQKLAEGVPVQGTVSDEYRVLCRDGSFRWISFSSFAELQRGYVFSVGRDVTEARRAEEARRQLETQLMQAQKMEGIGRLAGGIAHDFNNILAVILSYATFAKGALPAEDPIHGDLEEIEVAATRGSDLTRQLLAFSRKSIINPVILDLNLNLAGLERMIQRIVGEDIAFAVERAEGLWPVRVDPSSIDQILLNLVVNARDAMPTGGRLTIETRNLGADELAAWPEVAPGEYVQVAVSDTGSGMTPEVKARLFEPFFTTKREGKGTGLGLATVYGVVKQYGGYVFVESEPGRGARFVLLFPRSEAALVAPAKGVVQLGEPPRPATVLVVDDEPSLRRIAVRALQSRGYQVVDAGSGAEAIDKAQGHAGDIDVVLTDVVMPGMNGRQMVEALRRDRPSLRVLYMTGYTDDAVARHGILRQEVQLLQKPFTPGALLAAVAGVVASIGDGASAPG